MNKNIFLISLLMLLLFSCEDGFVTDCRECATDSIGHVKLKLLMGSIVYDPAYRMVTIYEGAIEDSLILKRFGTDLGYMEIDAMLYKNYTVTLQFVTNGKRYTAIDAACPQVRYDENKCDQPCYYVYDNVIDLRIRYNK